jgi:hypothetical protein
MLPPFCALGCSGVVEWLFSARSSEFGYDFEAAVRIRVKNKNSY